MKIKETLTQNLGLKLLAIFLATVLWLFVKAGEKAEIDITFPVRYTNLSSGLVIVNRPPSRIDVRFAGPRILLLRLRTDRPPLLLDMKDAGEGTTKFPGVESGLQIPTGVRVVRVTPAEIDVTLARTGNRLIPGEHE